MVTGTHSGRQSIRPGQRREPFSERRVRSSLRPREKPGARKTADLDLIFSALSSPTRRAIIDRLSRGESIVTELARPFNMSLPAISKHLDVLEKAEMISRVKEGRTYVCRIDPASLRFAAGWLNTYGSLWKRQLNALAGYLESPEGGS